MIIFLLFIVILLLLLLLYLQQQRKIDKAPYREEPGKQVDARLPEFERDHDLILMVKPGYTVSDVVEFIRKNYPQLAQEPKIVPYCLSCDNMLFSVEGFTFTVLGQTVESPKDPGPRTPIKPNGDEVPFLYTPNYKIRLPKQGDNFSEKNRAIPLPPPGEEAGDAVLVAVLDTGLRTEIAENYKTGPVSHCRGSLGLYGYNVIADSSNTNDDFTGNGNVIIEHGTPVTGLVLRYANRQTNVKILPIKVLDDKGHGTLLQLMCGLAYAKNAGARIINTSLGFYAADPEQVIFFKTFLDRLTTDNTLIIASAGNEELEEDKLAAKEIGTANLRNIDHHLFYPAGFSGFNKNIITATTIFAVDTDQSGNINALQVSPRQNYSSSKVQIGVEADVAIPLLRSEATSSAVNDYVFLNPYGPEAGGQSWKLWSGSSFAAPILTGLVAATYYQYLDERNGEYDRSDYLKWLAVNNYLKRKSDWSMPANAETDKVPLMLLMKPDEWYYVSTLEKTSFAKAR